MISLAQVKSAVILKPDGSLSIDIFLKTDGSLEIGGNVDNMIRYGPLNTALQSHNAAINMELGKIAAAISTLGGTYLPDTISTDISASKIDQVKTL